MADPIDPNLAARRDDPAVRPPASPVGVYDRPAGAGRSPRTVIWTIVAIVLLVILALMIF